MRQFIYRITHPFIRLYWKIFKPRTKGARAIVIHGNQILLVRGIGKKHWSLPGGRIELRETPEDTVIRELKEELDLDIHTIEYKLGRYYSELEGKKDEIHIFVVKTTSTNFSRQWEIEDAQWFELNDLPPTVPPAGLRRIKEYQAGIKDIRTDW